MKKKLISIVILVMICLVVTTNTVYAKIPINPSNDIYKEGIYKLNKSDTGQYQLQFQFLNKDVNSAIIVLDENAGILYKNINCNRKCNAGIITNKDTIVIITDGEVQLSFTKIN